MLYGKNVNKNLLNNPAWHKKKIYHNFMPPKDLSTKYLTDKKAKAAMNEILDFISGRIRKQVDTWGDITKIREKSGLADGTINKLLKGNEGRENPTFIKFIKLMYGAEIKIEDMAQILVKHGLAGSNIDPNNLKLELAKLLDTFLKNRPN